MEGWGAATPVSHRALQRKQKVLLTWRGSCLESELVASLPWSLPGWPTGQVLGIYPQVLSPPLGLSFPSPHM